MNELQQLLTKIVSPEQGGFLTSFDIQALARNDRSRDVLVRCGACRFTISADSVDHIAGIIERDGTDYIRDVSLLASDAAFRGIYTAVTPKPPSAIERAKAQQAARAYLMNSDLEVDAAGRCYSDADPGL